MKKICKLCVLIPWLLVGGAVIFSPSAPPTSAQEQLQENPVIGYRDAVATDPIARLQKQLDSGQAQLEYSEESGYLQSVLKLLRVPVSSQGLVFSKTSLQLHRISPKNPRAIYFNDDVYVGWVRGGDVLEVAAVDPQMGGVFYRLDQAKSSKPRFTRNDDCLQCHVSNGTRGIPGFVVRSVYPDETGYHIAPLGQHVTNHASPLIERWGGWYVTGTHGNERHAGNLIYTEKSQPDKPEQLTRANLTTLDKNVDLKAFPTPHSDIVALMVLEHQTQMHNLLTRLNYQTRLALHDQEAMNRALGEPLDQWSDSTRRRIYGPADEVLKYLLFVDETRLQSPVSGTSNFAKEFAALGPKDKQGRSLRDFDLKHRLFRYPCSYVIYTTAFDSLPKPALDYLYRKLWLVLTGQAQEKEFAALTASDRKAILEILRETKQNLPDYFQSGG